MCARGTVSIGGARYLLLHRLAEGCAPGGEGAAFGGVPSPQGAGEGCGEWGTP